MQSAIRRATSADTAAYQLTPPHNSSRPTDEGPPTENCSDALQSWTDQRAEELLVTSTLARAEVQRAIRRNNHTASGALIDPDALEAELAGAAEVLHSVAQIVIDDAILDRAASLESPLIRPSDAIHLASAAEFDVQDLKFGTYDHRLAAVAEAQRRRERGPIWAWLSGTSASPHTEGEINMGKRRSDPGSVRQLRPVVDHGHDGRAPRTGSTSSR